MNKLTPNIDQTPAVLSFNYETFKAQLEQRIAQYRTVVTADTVKDAKETATELNKLKTELDTERKEAIKFVSAPIKKADDQMKECVRIIADGRQEILDQVAKFDQARLDTLRQQLTVMRDETRAKVEVKPEFQGTADSIEDLVKLSNLTATDRPTAKAGRDVHDRVMAERQLQQTVERRLLELENASYRAGLSVPLERTHVEHFLFADEAAYSDKLQRLMDVEITRQKQAEEKQRQAAHREREQQEAEQQREQARQDRMQTAEPEAPAPTPAPEQPVQAKQEPVPSGSEHYTLNVTLTATLPAGMAVADVESQFREFIEGSGVAKVKGILVTPARMEDAA